MTNDFTIQTLCTRITELRKNAGMTQAGLAEKLSISFQAVSKWENMLSCPDILLLPQIAEIFDVTIDYLFGKDAVTEEKAEESPCEPVTAGLPWENDRTLRAVLFEGTRLVKKEEYQKIKTELTFVFEGEAKDIVSDFNVSCRDVAGNVRAVSVNGGNVGGNVKTTSIFCGNVNGAVETLSCSCGNVYGDIRTKSLNCGNIEGGVSAAVVNCGDITGDVVIQSENGLATLTAGAIDGELTMKNATVTCDNVLGDVTVGGDEPCKTALESGAIDGTLTIRNAVVTCDGISGDVTVVGDEPCTTALEGGAIDGALTIRNAVVTCDDVLGDVSILGEGSNVVALEANAIDGDLTIQNATVTCDEVIGDVRVEGGKLN